MSLGGSLFGTPAIPGSFILQIRTSTTLDSSNLQNRYVGSQSNIVTSPAAAAVWITNDDRKLNEADGPGRVYGLTSRAERYKPLQVSVPASTRGMNSGNFDKEEIGTAEFLEWSNVIFGDGASLAIAAWCVVNGEKGQEVPVGPVALASGVDSGDKLTATYRGMCDVGDDDPVAGGTYFLQAVPAEDDLGLLGGLLRGLLGSG